MRQQDGDKEKRITDSSFAIAGIESNDSKQYHLECQSTTDGSMLIRMYEYDSQIALIEGVLEGEVLNVHFPQSAILYLRHNSNTPDIMKICISSRLEQMCMDETLDRYTKMTICEMAQKVVEALANKFANVKKEVTSVMGGNVLEYKAKDILKQGKAIGLDALIMTLRDMLPDAESVHEAVIRNEEYRDVTLEQIRKYYR